MRIVKFTREERIINSLMVNAFSIENLGLVHGKMGVVLYFYILSRVKNNKVFADFAKDLLDNVVESLHDKLPLDFEEGIIGIGWAVEYLIQNGFVEANADEVLEEIDKNVNNTLIHSEKNLKITLAIGHYLNARLRYRVDNEESQQVLNFKYHTILYIDELERQIQKAEPTAEVAYLLAELHKLNIFNHKIEKLQRYVGDFKYQYIFPMIEQLSSEQIEEQLNSKDVPSKYAGFDLSNIPEEQRWGLSKGIAGIGLQKIFQQLNTQTLEY